MPDGPENIDLKEVFESHSSTLVPESLQSLFGQELEELVSATRKSIELKAQKIKGYSINPGDEVNMALNQWVSNKLRMFTYHRYAELLKEQGKKPHSIRKFLQGRPGGFASIYDLMRIIEQNKIRIGVRGYYSGKLATVKGIHSDGYLTLVTENGGQPSHVHPLSFEPKVSTETKKII